MRQSIDAVFRIVRQVGFILDRRQKKASIVVFMSMLISSGLELLGVSAIYPFLQIMLTPEEMQSRWYISWIYNICPAISDRGVILGLGIVIIFVYLTKNAFMIVGAYMQNAFAAKFQRALSVRMLSAYLDHSYQYFLNTNSSEIIRGISNDVSGVYQILLNIFTLLAESLTILMLGMFLLVTDWGMTIGAMALASACLMATIAGFKNRMKLAGKKSREASALKYQYSYQAVMGIKEIIVLDRKRSFLDRFKEAALVEQKALIVNGVITACPDRILEGVCIGGIIGMVCIRIACGIEVATFIPVLGAFAMAAFKILPSVSKISTRINSIIYYQSYLQGAYNTLKETKAHEALKYENIPQTENVSDNEEDIATGMESDGRVSFERELKIGSIDWKYQNAKGNVLENASLTIHKGESVAFIGSSGAGKTTLADIIMGLLKPQKGTVEMDGIDIYSIPHQWCRIIGYVPQSVFLIDDTVRANVAFGLKENEIEEDKVWEALRQAQLKEFVEDLPNGLDTIVGERGVKFSGGQRQRIAIARALYEEPDILILDEATSALDNETETAVMESIDALQGSKTLIIVAHRLSTIRNCDRIYEIADGVAVERKKEEVLLTV